MGNLKKVFSRLHETKFKILDVNSQLHNKKDAFSVNIISPEVVKRNTENIKALMDYI